MTAWETALAESWEHGTAGPDEQDDARDAAARTRARSLIDTETWR